MVCSAPRLDDPLRAWSVSGLIPGRVLSSLIYDWGTLGPLRGAQGVGWSVSGLIPGRVLSSLIYDSGTLGPLRGARVSGGQCRG